jgi:hypothetical protein
MGDRVSCGSLVVRHPSGHRVKPGSLDVRARKVRLDQQPLFPRKLQGDTAVAR